MKALNLKSMSWIMALAMMFIVSFTGCSDDDGENTPGEKIEFPTLQEATCNADGTITISFKATVDWKLTSNAGWCKFVDGEFTQSSITGKAGEQTITAKISGDGQNYSDDNVAEITLTLGEKEQVIYKITRPKKVFNGLTIKDENGNVYNTENPIIIKGSGYEKIDVVYTTILTESEFEVGISTSENPDWIKVENKGEGKFNLTFNNDNTEGIDPKYSISTEKGHKLVFGVQTTNEGLINVSVPVAYEGLKENVLLFKPEYINALTVNPEGTVFTETSSGSMGSTEGVKYENQLSSTITVRDDKFHVLKITEIKTPAMGTYFYTYDVTQEPDWVTVVEEGTKLTLTVAALPEGAELRGAAILVIPEVIWNKIKDTDLQATLFTRDSDNGASMDYLNDEYTDYIWTHFTQEPKEDEPTADITFKAFYTETAIDFNNIKLNDLKAFDGDYMIQKGTDFFEYETAINPTNNVWNAMFPKEALHDKKSVLFQIIGDIPEGYDVGTINYINWYYGSSSENRDGYIDVEFSVKTIEGNKYIVITGKDGKNITITDKQVSIGVSTFDESIGNMKAAAECVIGLF